MKQVKWFTQRITMIIVLTWILLFPYVLAQAIGVTGFWKAIDTLNNSGVHAAFWILFIVTRLGFALAWVYSSRLVIVNGQKWGFLWFKPEKSIYPRDDHKEQDLDYSLTIALVITVIGFAVLFAELAIRLSTGMYKLV